MQKAQIFIFEDESIIAMELKRKLERMGYAVPQVESFGEEAAEKVKAVAPDLVLMDVMLEGNIDGIQAAAAINDRVDVPVVFLTAYSDDHTLQRAKLTQPYGYVLKPFDERELRTVIELALYKHEMEQKLREHEQWLETTLESIGEAVVSTDKSGHIIFVNHVAEKLTGWENQDVVGQNIQNIFRLLEIDSKELIQYSSQRLSDLSFQKMHQNQCILLKKNGEQVVVEETQSQIRDAHDEVTGFVFAFRDMTKRREIEKALRESEERFRSVVENAPTGILILDETLRIIYVNDELIRLIGYPADEVIGQELSRFLSQDQVHELDKLELSSLKRDRPRRIEVTLIQKTGQQRIVDLSTTTIQDVGGKHNVVMQVLDMTERMHLERQLRQAQKMKAVGTLAGGVAHDFNNLLTAIRGCTDLAIRMLDQAHPAYVELQEVLSSANRASDLTRQLLAFSRNQPLEFKNILLNRLIEDILKMLHRLIGEDIGIRTHLADDLWIVRADRGSIEEVVMNLAINARDAMPKGGQIEIHTANVVIDEAHCAEHPEARCGSYVCLSVSDTGEGMSPNTLARIFEPFFSTKVTGKGTGLGLAVVYGIIKQHNGWVHVESEPAQGSTFKIYIQRSSGEIETARESEKLEDYRGSGERILVVEDEDRVRELFEKFLSQHGYTIFTAIDVEDAESVFQREQGQFDLIFSDVVLPDGTGIDLVDRFLEEKPELRIMLSSGYADQKSQWQVIKDKGYPFFPKPFTLLNLLKSIQGILRS